MSCSVTKVLLNEGVKPMIKWPNDLLLNGKKLCGALAESDGTTVFLGVGLNVNMEAEDFAEVDQKATSLKVETGRTWDKDLLLKNLQEQFEKDLATFRKEGFAPFFSFFDKRLAHKGKSIEWSNGISTWRGICRGLRLDGGLDIELSDGTIAPLYSGEITTSSLQSPS
jgi:BirA family biotin operon repressor/biotin-[acetyl-CoA-carboxylase] ligase